MSRMIMYNLVYVNQMFQSNGESDDKDSPDAVSPVSKSTGMQVKFTCSDSEL